MNEKRDCIHYSEVQDMNATVSCCDFYEFGNTPCKDCKRYYSKKDLVEVVRCKYCKYSIWGGIMSNKYLCTRKSSVTHLEEHEANYFCADGERKDDNE